MRVAIGSKNPVKIEAVSRAYVEAYPGRGMEFIPLNAPSSVSRQPMSNEETRIGAINRAKFALEKSGADYGVGLEGGLHPVEGQWYCIGWVAIVDKKGVCSLGSTAMIAVPKKVMNLIFEGMELGEAADATFGAVNSKQKGGFSSFLTNGVLNRTDEYRIPVHHALSRFLHPELFETPSQNILSEATPNAYSHH